MRGKRTGRVHRSRSGRRPMEQIHKLRIWMIVLAVLATAAVVGLGLYFWYSFSQPFRAVEERNSAPVTSSFYENHEDLPIYPDDFNLMLVNDRNPIPEEFSVELAAVNGVEVDRRVAVYLRRMVADAKADGVSLIVKSGYRSPAEQQQRYDEKIQMLLESGLSRIKAEDRVARTVGTPGCSDFQTGMAVTFTTRESGEFDETEAFRWLMQNGIHYGFIQRYPEAKTDYTRHAYEKSHFRFVSEKHAIKMRELEMCLEEYVDYRNMQRDS